MRTRERPEGVGSGAGRREELRGPAWCCWPQQPVPPAPVPLHPYIRSHRAHTISGHRDCLWLLATHHPLFSQNQGPGPTPRGLPVRANPPPFTSILAKFTAGSLFLRLSQTALSPPCPPGGGPRPWPLPTLPSRRGGPEASPRNPIPEPDFNTLSLRFIGANANPKIL